jgi:membrane protein
MKLTDLGKVSAMNRSETGRQAESPAQIPMRGWRQVLQRSIRKSQEHNTALLAAGVAFFAFLALYPALIALVTLVALVVDPSQITQQVQSFTVGLPPAARALISDPLAALARGNSGARTLGLVASLLVALWSASSGTSSLMTAVNLAYDEQETRGFLKFRAIALLLTLGAIVFLVLTLALIAVVPVVLNAVHLGAAGLVLAQALRWVLLFALIIVGLATIYRVAPDRNPPKFRWVSLGSIVVALLWLLGSLGFSLYVNFFGNYNKVYGTLAGAIVLLLWLYLTCYIIVLGAEINAEAERQTECDSTVGEPKPMGQRGAVVADTASG